MLQPVLARELGERTAAAVLATGADLIVTAEPGVREQVTTTLARMGKQMPVAHTVHVVGASIGGVPVEQLLDGALDGSGAAPARPGDDRHPTARTTSREASPWTTSPC